MSFLNRTKECHELSAIIRQNANNNCVIILSGTTGVGKSGLAQHLFRTRIHSKESICVRVSKSSPDSIESTHYLNAVYRSFVEYAKANKASTLSPKEHALKDSSNVLRMTKDWLKNRAGFSESSKLYQPTYELSLVQKKDYIIDILKIGEFILNIENIQNIDTVSFEMLFEIIKSVSKTTFLFEYTTAQEDNAMLLNFYNELATVCSNAHIYSIEKLPFVEARSLAPSDIKIDDSLLSNIYSNSNGNLMQIILANQRIGAVRDSIQTTLASLGKDDNYIVSLVYWSGGELEGTDLLKMLAHQYANGAHLIFQDSFFESVKRLVDMNVIDVSNQERYAIAHDSILEELERMILNPQLLLAYSVVKNYLLEQLRESPNNPAIVDSLFSLLIRQGDEDLISILPNVQKVIQHSKYPKKAISKLMFYQATLEARGVSGIHTSRLIYEQLITICVDRSFYKYAQELLDRVYQPTDPYHVALQASIYGGQCDSEAIDKIVDRFREKGRLNLTLRLCKLVATMMSRPREDSIEIVTALLEEYADCEYLEYAYLLRNYAELVDDNGEAIVLYNRCIDTFFNFNKQDQIAEVRLSLAMIYAYIADLDEARKQLIAAHQMSDTINESYLLNNHAVIDILSGKLGDEVQKKLTDALLINGDEYERLIIMCNLLVCYINTHKFEQAKEMCSQIESANYKKYQYDEFLHIIFTNLLYYYQTFTDIDKAKHYKEELDSIVSRQNTSTLITDLRNSLLHGSPSHHFYANFPYRVDFLGYWAFRIDPELRNY